MSVLFFPGRCVGDGPGGAGGITEGRFVAGPLLVVGVCTILCLVVVWSVASWNRLSVLLSAGAVGITFIGATWFSAGISWGGTLEVDRFVAWGVTPWVVVANLIVLAVPVPALLVLAETVLVVDARSRRST